ncbi:serine/threonine-protein kinase SBK1 [Pimephales promelas]|nr:serine/threonine-protein kinase SBK1 [Pimephales promelas]
MKGPPQNRKKISELFLNHRRCRGNRPLSVSGIMSSSPHMSRSSIDILEELQLITAENLEKLDFNKYYEVIRELGKGTYGKVDLVIHKIRGRLKGMDSMDDIDGA